MKTDLDRVLRRLEALYACGTQPDGTHSRLAFSPEDSDGRRLYSSYFQAMGLTPSMDAAGNLRVRLPGKNNALPAILVDSHLDTVPDGGKYDGALGCVAALELFEVLHAAGKALEHPLEAIVFSDEEGARFGKGLFGSSAVCGAPLPVSPGETNACGMDRARVLQDFGVRLDALEQAAIPRQAVHCFLELHIEQGGALEKSGTPIGIVSSIAGVDRFELTFTGQANHAGSTLMCDRKDALVAAAAFAAAVPEIVAQYGGSYSVATVGRFLVEPGSVNVVPGRCILSLEIRDREQSVMNLLRKALLSRAREIAGTGQIALTLNAVSACPPAPMSERICGVMEQICQDAQLPYCLLPSGAFHDSLLMTSRFPTGMLFIPSRGGISHSPLEYSAPEDIQNGCELLLKTVLALDTENI